jgi:CBS domain-containing protein
MQVREVMGPVSGSISTDDLLRDATAKMKSLGMDPLPVTEGNKVVGMLSSRSVMDRVGREGIDGGLVRVRDVMSHEITCCYADQEVGEAVDTLQHSGVDLAADRVPVVDRDGVLVGVASLRNLRERDPNADDGTTAVQAVESTDQLVDYDRNHVEYMSDQSFPASDPPTSNAFGTIDGASEGPTG